jgi:uncharacterized protein (DUF305 family)
MRASARLSTLLLLLLLAVGACGAAESRTLTLGGTAASEVPTTVERPWGTVKVFPAMQKDQEPVPDDVAFAQEMVMHHRQAIEISENLLAHDGLDERVEASASFIVQDQKNEIGIMETWLQAWDQPVKPSTHGAHASGSMPGMLQQRQVDRIATLPTPASQIAFLVGMIKHHQGAITMSQDYLPVQGNAFTRSSAQHIITEQRTEIQYMENVIDDLCDADPIAACP